MRRTLVLSALLLAALALPAAAETAPPAALQAPQVVECSQTPALSPLAPAPLASAEDLLTAAGLVEDRAIATGTLPDCPTVRKCPSGPYNKCKGTNCGTFDTGYEACQSGSAAFTCPSGQTIHVTSCQCATAFQARCCTTFPACICVRCDAFTSTSLSCQ